MLYGERRVAESELIAFPNPNPDRRYEIYFECPEFTCLCPLSGFPDFATIKITYTPDRKCVELKALKFYINRFRNEKAFHEAVINQICTDLVRLLDPHELKVVGDFNVRGNIKTIVTVSHTKPGSSRDQREFLTPTSMPS